MIAPTRGGGADTQPWPQEPPVERQAVPRPQVPLREHDSDADFAAFYRANVDRLIIQLYAYTADMAQAQDVVQEAFARALPRWRNLSDYNDPSAWVRRVAWNLATSRWRHLRVTHAYARRQRPTHIAGPNADHVALTRALATLPLAQRRAVVLHYLADLSVAEIADQEGVAEGTVKSWLYRGRAALAAQLSDPDDEKRSKESTDV